MRVNSKACRRVEASGRQEHGGWGSGPGTGPPWAITKSAGLSGPLWEQQALCRKVDPKSCEQPLLGASNRWGLAFPPGAGPPERLILNDHTPIYLFHC